MILFFKFLICICSSLIITSFKSVGNCHTLVKVKVETRVGIIIRKNHNHNHKPQPQTVSYFFSAPTQPNSTKFSMQSYFKPTRRFMGEKNWVKNQFKATFSTSNPPPPPPHHPFVLKSDLCYHCQISKTALFKAPSPIA